MNPPDRPSHPSFEDRIKSVPIRELAPDHRDTILENATARDSRPARHWWRLPKPLIWAVAACWLASLGLQLTIPETRMGSVAEGHSNDLYKLSGQNAMLIAWVERARALTKPSTHYEF
jgi:hypothetical protein